MQVSWVRDKELYYSNSSSQSIIIFLCLFHELQFPYSNAKKSRYYPHMQCIALQERSLQLRESESFIIDIKHGCRLFQRETFFFYYTRLSVHLIWIPSISSKAVQYTNILKKIVRNKSSQCLCL